MRTALCVLLCWSAIVTWWGSCVVTWRHVTWRVTTRYITATRFKIKILTKKTQCRHKTWIHVTSPPRMVLYVTLCWSTFDTWWGMCVGMWRHVTWRDVWQHVTQRKLAFWLSFSRRKHMLTQHVNSREFSNENDTFRHVMLTYVWHLNVCRHMKTRNVTCNNTLHNSNTFPD